MASAACFWANRTLAQSSTSCVPALALEGELGLVHGVRAYLAARGVSFGGPSRCGALLVSLSSEDGRVRVRVTDPHGQTDSRIVSDTQTASVFVESRLRIDLALALPEPESGRAEQAHHRPDAAAAQSSIPVGFRLRPGVSLASDGSTWLDVSATSCVQIEPLCLGVMVRGSLDLAVSGRSAVLPTERAGVDVLVSGEIPIALGPSLQLVPGLAIGAGWLRSGPRGRAEGPGASVEVAVDFGGPRIESFVRISWKVAERWALGAGLFALVDPLAHTVDVRDPEALLAGNPILRIGGALELEYRVR